MSHWDFLSPEGKSAREVAIKEIEGKFRDLTGIEVNYQILPWQEMGTKLIAAVQAGNPPDGSRVNLFHLKMILLGDGLQELDPYLNQSFSDDDKKDFLVDFSPAMVVKGKKWSMQIEAIPKALFIRKDWLTQAGMQAPKTWDEFVEVGKKMTSRGRWGYMYGASKTQLNQLETMFQPQIQGRNGRILDDNDRAVFNDDIGVKAYQFLADCVLKHKITPPQVIGMTYDDVTDAFKAGRVGMIQEGAHRYQDILKAVGPDNLMIAKVPSDDPNKPSPTIVTGWGMGIPRGSKHPDAAWEHLKYYIGADAQEINARVAGTLPSRKSVLERPYFQTPEAAHLRWWVDYMAERSETVINVSTFAQLNETMVDVLHRVLVDASSQLKPLLDEAAKKYNQIAGL
ncbi:sugar ABC transporter substrate-binding protein [Alsobacter sp. KACC 23698]|uniref:Sugar ABC transporter substrate-binding protein n=1 Tax=Alsobacter sp. KACC 23698 TaxID=3149229 RepID=A0AAU7JJF1_9HYPH